MRQLAPDPEVLAQVVQLVAVKLEEPACGFKSINRLVRRRRSQALGDEASIALTDIKSVTIVGDENVRFIKEIVEVFDEVLVILLVLFEQRIVGQRVNVNFVAPLSSRR